MLLIFSFFTLCTLSSEELLLQLGQTLADDAQMSSAHFEKAFDDVRCDDPPLTTSKIASSLKFTFQICKERCQQDPRCRWFAYWTKKRYCETYASCTSRSPDAGNSIFLYQRLNECEAERGVHGQGRYPQLIAAAFPKGIIRISGPRQNLHCKCATPAWMFCGILVEAGSEEEAVVRAKLNRNDLRNMLPFHPVTGILQNSILAEAEDAPIVFTPSGKTDKIHAEIEILDSGSCLSLDQCLDGTPYGVCPITKEMFIAGDPVYILKSDQDDSRNGLPIPCISVPALWARSMSEYALREGGFVDPLSRDSDKLRLIQQDYSIAFIFDQEQLSGGMCGNKMAMRVPAPKKTDSSPSGTSQAGPSSAGASQSEEGSSSQSNRRRRKPKSKGSGKKASSQCPTVSPIPAPKLDDPSQFPPLASSTSHQLSREGGVIGSWRKMDGSAIPALPVLPPPRDKMDPGRIAYSFRSPRSGSSSRSELSPGPIRESIPQSPPQPTVSPSVGSVAGQSEDEQESWPAIGSIIAIVGLPGENGESGTVAYVKRIFRDTGTLLVSPGSIDEQMFMTSLQNVAFGQNLEDIIKRNPVPISMPEPGHIMIVHGLEIMRLNGQVVRVEKVNRQANKVRIRFPYFDQVGNVKPSNLIDRDDLKIVMQLEAGRRMGLSGEHPVHIMEMIPSSMEHFNIIIVLILVAILLSLISYCTQPSYLNDKYIELLHQDMEI